MILWKKKGEKLIRKFNEDVKIKSVAFSSDKETVASVGRRFFHIMKKYNF